MKPKCKQNEKKESISFGSWHSVVLMRSDNDYIYLCLYGTNDLKKGVYSIKNNFTLYCYSIEDSSIQGSITIPTTAISIYRRDWGFELYCKRSEITNIKTGPYVGVGVVSTGPLVIEAT